MAGLTLTLPMPKSPNRRPANPFARQRQKDEYRAAVWMRAWQQQKPDRDPPEQVRISSTFYYAKHPRDEDNLAASLKDLLDALRQKQTGSLRWRQGLYDQCGYFVDDDPSHATITTPEQRKCKTLKEERVELTIEQA